jgi:hypothetical protein
MLTVQNDPIFNEGVNPRRLPEPIKGAFPTTHQDTPDDQPRALMVKDEGHEYTLLSERYGHNPVWVNTHLVDQASGGPEEGGWFYTYGIPESSIKTTAADAARLYTLAYLDAERENADRRSDIGSVLSEGRFEVSIETHYATSYPTERPRYE